TSIRLQAPFEVLAIQRGGTPALARHIQLFGEHLDEPAQQAPPALMAMGECPELEIPPIVGKANVRLAERVGDRAVARPIEVAHQEALLFGGLNRCHTGISVTTQK